MNEYICIVCPNSCKITVTEQDGALQISGNLCKRGEEFVKAEHTNPVRVFTSTVQLRGAWLPRLSVMTSGEVPKNKLMDCQEAIQKVIVTAPVACGDVVVKDICGLGVDLVATRSFEAL